MDSLDPTFPVIGIVLLAGFGFWVIGRRSDTLEDAFDSLPAAVVAFAALLASPFFFYAAWHQLGAKERLLRENLPVSPAFGYAVGAQGGRAPRFVWRFRAEAAPAAILADYEARAQTAGWKIDRRKNGLLLQKPEVVFAMWIDQRNREPQVVLEKRPPSGTK